MYNLTFISDKELLNHVYDTVKKYSFSMDLRKFNKNLIDPIKLTFDSIVYNQSYEETIENEVLRQLDKSNSNLIGYFHQNIFKYFSSDWHVPQQGYDIENTREAIFVEMKNKHNTMNSSSSAKTYMRMQNSIIKNPNATCLLVEVIAKKSQNIPWVVTLDGQKQSANHQIRRVSIDKFYELVTGDKNAFQKLCKALPTVIKDATSKLKNAEKANTVFDELNKLSPDLLTSIYLLSFKNYEGFNDFNLDTK
ncbi:Eco47II family restriction endonuclease [Aureispira anguillae]|uniref:Eco47II family restriction endonuclease n=1 Tax=Aureispira anguillae TaxID=2864201 RepID=A0A915YD23_9BACT|nr:Eco47II family restriction endonuclease [Aureispira anguillae]BDS10833.1 Eco47II family restriction endonuclease [Aureispira anguillae]